MTEKSIHSGHRERVIESACKGGFEYFSEVQVLEFVLFYIFPRGDVNPLAHRLLDKFKNLAGVLQSQVEDLQEVEGMGEMSSKKLHGLLLVFSKYFEEKNAKSKKISTMGELFDYLEGLLRYKQNEEVHIFGINANGQLVSQRKLASGDLSRVKLELKDIALFVSSSKVNGVVLAHNHPNGSCMASETDCETNEKLSQIFKFAGCTLIDNLVVGSDGIYSIKDQSKKRMFVS